nr:helix-turn-helix transcriptional regulator [Bifidobacterium lemurum]
MSTFANIQLVTEPCQQSHLVALAAMPEEEKEHLTEELLDRLLASSNVETYLEEEHVTDRKLTDYLYEIMDERGLKRADVVRDSGLNPTVVYDIFSGKSRPGRDNAIMLSFGLNCSLRQTQRLLRLAGVSELWCKQRRDAILIWCVHQGFDRTAADDELRRMGEKPLLA